MFYGFWSEEVRRLIVETRDRMVDKGEFPGEDKLEEEYKEFRKRFSLEILRRLNGEELIEGIFNVMNKDSLAYWLEFKKDNIFETKHFGSISGGSALKYIMYKRKADQKWVYGQKQTEMGMAEAIKKGSEIRDAIMRGAEWIEANKGEDYDYSDLENRLIDVNGCQIYKYGWIHKYYHMIFPEKIDTYHAGFFHRHALICLGIQPANKWMLYCLTGQMIHVVRDMRPMPTAQVERALMELYGNPINYYRMDINLGGYNDAWAKRKPGNEEVTSGGRAWEFMKKKGQVCLGWKELGDLGIYVGRKDKELKEWMEIDFVKKYEDKEGTSWPKINEIFRFYMEMNTNDLVTVAQGEKVLGVGKITGNYEFKEGLDFPHTRNVEWLYLGEAKLITTEKNKEGICEIYKEEQNMLKIRQLAAVGIQDRNEGEMIRTIMPYPDENTKMIGEILKRKKQVILHGPPGTGKTYYAEKAAFSLAAWKAFNKKWMELNEEEKKEVRGHGGKKGLVRMCCFHPSYGYEDFMEGIKPMVLNGQVVFEKKDGIFKEICKDAGKNLHREYYLIIDEINRGEISRIFGELITIIEANKREKTINLPVSGEEFMVPPNLFLIGTMNTADRSIAFLDVALRRRFGFMEFLPDYELLEETSIKTLPLGEWLKNLNERICKHLGREARNQQIGHSYFMVKDKPINSPELFKKILREDICPLLEDYCCNDYDKLADILGPYLVDKNGQRLDYGIFNQDFNELANALLALCPEIQIAADSQDGSEEEDEEEDESGQ